MRFLRTVSRGHSRLIAARASPIDDRKPAFQYHPKGTVSFEDLQDAHAIFSEFPQEHRNECYAMYNINGDAVEKYYRHALAFERSYQSVAESERKKKSFYIKFGPFHIYISTDK